LCYSSQHKRFFHQLVSGNQGLGAYLKDGSGYNKSAFQPLNSQEENDKDPLSWLSLPKLDFVDVKGQEDALLAGTRVGRDSTGNE
jgi:hypothetical protein